MKNLLTENIDIWTTAQIQKNGVGRGNGSAKQNLHGIKKLRELILELAVRGKLVSQDPNEEPASILLKKIAAEKARLIKEGKIKKQEPLLNITEDEKTFELPRGWEWVRLGEVTEFVNGYTFKSGDFSDTGVGIVKIGDIQNGEITTSSMSRVDQNIVAGLDDSLKVNTGDMLIAMSGATTGKLGFNRTKEVFYINQRVGKIIPYCLYVEYLYHPLTTKISENLAKSMGSAIPNLSTVQIKDIVFALPPITEQHRIVAKVDELMVLCDQLEQKQTDSNAAHQTLVETLLATLTSAANQDEFIEAWQRIASHFDILFTTELSIDQLKQTILQLAVMGKLVKQDQQDEPTHLLIRQIAEERERRAKAGEPVSNQITADSEDAGFIIPKSWLWVKLGFATNIIMGQSPPGETYNTSGEGVPLINGPVEFSQGPFGITIVNQYTTKPNKLCKKGDLLLCVRGSTTGRTNIAGFDACIGRGVAALQSLYDDRFIRLFVWSWRNKIIDMGRGIAFPSISRQQIEDLPMPFPPLAEQHRIVAKVDELMSICDNLKARLQEAQTTQIHLADAIVEQAVS